MMMIMISFIPVSGLVGTNLTSVDNSICAWYNGPSLIEYLGMMMIVNDDNDDNNDRFPQTRQHS